MSVSRKLSDYVNIDDLKGYYERIDSLDCHVMEDSAIEIPKKVYSEICERIDSDYGWNVVYAPVSKSDYRNNTQSAIVIEDHSGEIWNNYMTIFMTDDEWYYVSFCSGASFKCDQVEGLYKFLQKINVFPLPSVTLRKKMEKEKKSLISDITRKIMTFSDFSEIKDIRDKIGL